MVRRILKRLGLELVWREVVVEVAIRDVPMRWFRCDHCGNVRPAGGQ